MRCNIDQTTTASLEVSNPSMHTRSYFIHNVTTKTTRDTSIFANSIVRFFAQVYFLHLHKLLCLSAYYLFCWNLIHRAS